MTDVYPTVYEQAQGIFHGWLEGIAWRSRQRHCDVCCCPGCTGVMLALLGDMARLRAMLVALPPAEVRPS